MEIAVSGAGPALVLLHGWAMHGGVFAPLQRLLEARYTLHVVDLPGHGRSRDSAVPMALDAIADGLVERVPPALWCGWSLGGLVALATAARHPSAVRGLAMLCASPRFVRADDWPEGMDAAIFHRFAADLAQDYRMAIDRFLLLETLGSAHAREELRALRDCVFAHGEPSPAHLRQGLRLLEDSDLRATLPALAMPSAWIAGRRDRIVAAPAMQRAATACAGRFAEVASAGHAPFLTHADTVAAALDALAAEADWRAQVPS